MDEKIEMSEALREGVEPLSKRVLSHTLHLQDKKYDDTWTSCCMKMDRRAVRYFSQLCIALVIITFCIVQLVRNDSCEGQQLYSGILLTLIGIMLPAPSLH